MTTQPQPSQVNVQLDKASGVSNEAIPADDFSVDEILRSLSPEEWFPTARTDIPLWCL